MIFINFLSFHFFFPLIDRKSASSSGARNKRQGRNARKQAEEDALELPDEDESKLVCVNLDDWVQKPEIIQIFPCNEIRRSGEMRPRYS